MDPYEIIITPDAETDLLELRDYIADTLLVPDTAISYIRAIRTEIAKLSEMPGRIKPVDEDPWHSRGLRKINAKNSTYTFVSMSLRSAYISLTSSTTNETNSNRWPKRKSDKRAAAQHCATALLS
jgi:plasmid stabilization system protein ParE